MKQVTLRGLTMVYPNGIRAVDCLDLRVEAGEWLALIGPSGCGKTTTLRLIAGLESPTAGVVELDGIDARDLPPNRRDLAMVFQRPALYPHLSVKDNLAFSLRLRGQDPGRVADVANRLGLMPLLHRLPGELSGGQQQRVALGRALVRRPRLLLLDEPFSHLDQPLRAELRRELHLLRRDFLATMIHVTHDPVEALALGDRVAVLYEGRLQQVSPPDALLQRPVNRRVAALVHVGPTSFLDGILTGESAVLNFSTGALCLNVPRADWAPYRNRPVTLGFRAEDVVVGQGGAVVLSLEWTEPRGAVTLVGLAVPGMASPLVATAYRTDVGRFQRGGEVTVHFEMGRAMLFDRLTGVNLETSSG